MPALTASLIGWAVCFAILEIFFSPCSICFILPLSTSNPILYKNSSKSIVNPLTRF
nr:MAG TPA: hypothetical protein [Caudoviricetes sp.]